ncbi:MAG: PqqD family protein [Deltaproteobacteria bacterium]|nr:PqqD family protein [Deltaproteobacteria bacterium]
MLALTPAQDQQLHTEHFSRGCDMSDIRLDMAYVPSDDIMAREIEGELIIVLLTPGEGDQEDALYTLNETGKEFWQRLDGAVTLKMVAKSLASEYDIAPEEFERDLLSWVGELCKRRILVAVPAQ